MKRILAFLLAVNICIIFAACGKNDDPTIEGMTNANSGNVVEITNGVNNNTEDETSGAAVENNDKTEAMSNNAVSTTKTTAKTTTKSTTKATIKSTTKTTTKSATKTTTKATTQSTTKATTAAATVDASTTGGKFINNFRAAVKKSSNLSTIASSTFTRALLNSNPNKATVSEGYIAGFDAPIYGFESAVQCRLSRNTEPFVGYIFKLKADTDVAEFEKTLKDNANLRWQICVSGTDCVTDSYGDIVMFAIY